jgi:hypothetical protein
MSESVEMDQEDRERYERALKKKERKDFQKTHEATLDELVPKATGKVKLFMVTKYITS